MTTIDTLALTTSALTVGVGLFVAYQAYRGYRRNDSETMAALAVGIVCIAVLPYVVIYPIDQALGLTDAQTLVGALFFHTLGLLAICRSIT